ncbi:MAG: flagellar hook-basal body complex protein FliE [Phycisphaerae bacterium]|nr:flagellar hook-basal body complex protein FliE [Phycisphaerae bacterium]
MAGINPVSNIRVSMPQMRPTTMPGKAKEAPKTDFGDVLRSYIDGTDEKQKAAATAIRDLVAGKTTDVLPVVNAVAKADLSFKMLMGVRNKMIEAYKETMRMQI